MKAYSWNTVVRVIPYSDHFFIVPATPFEHGFEPCPTRECSKLVFNLFQFFNNRPKLRPYLTYAEIVEWSKTVNNGIILKSLSSFLRHLVALGILYYKEPESDIEIDASRADHNPSLTISNAWNQSFYKKPAIFSTPLNSCAAGLLNVVGLPICSTRDSFGTEVSPNIIRGLLAEPSYSLSYLPTQSDFVGYSNLTVPVVSDLGDLSKLSSPSDISQNLHHLISPLLDTPENDNLTKFLFLGGDHSITPITTTALFGDEPYTIIHLDAHSDFFFADTSHYLHSNPINHILANSPNVTIYSFGLRTGADLRPSGYDKPIDSFGSYSRISISELKSLIRNSIDFNSRFPSSGNVYFSIDLDVIEPHVFPWTSTPSSGGLAIDEFFTLFDILIKAYSPVAMDIVEFNCTKEKLDHETLRDLFLMLILRFCSPR